MSLMKQRYDEFMLVRGQILEPKLGMNPVELEEHKWNIIESYNNFIAIVVEDFRKVDRQGQSLLENRVKSARQKLVTCLDALGCVYVLPHDIYEVIEAATIGAVGVVLETNDGDLNGSKHSSMADEDPLRAQRELLKIVNNQIRKPYNGEPMGLQGFINNVEIVKNFATTDDLRGKLVTYVKGRLDGRAGEIVTNDVDTIENLFCRLRAEIRPDTSKVIEARIDSLRYSVENQEEFADRAEELADALRRTLVLEGMTQNKANEIVIDRMTRFCSRNAGSNVVKAVLSASKFETTQEVVAKLIIGNDECIREQRKFRYNYL